MFRGRLPPVTDASHLSQTSTTCHGQPLPVTDAYLCHGHLPPVKDAYHVPRKAKSDLFFFFVAHTLGNRLPDSKEVVGDVEKGKGCILKSTKRGSRRDKYSKLKTRKRRKGVFRVRRTSVSDNFYQPRSTIKDGRFLADVLRPESTRSVCANKALENHLNVE